MDDAGVIKLYPNPLPCLYVANVQNMAGMALSMIWVDPVPKA